MEKVLQYPMATAVSPPHKALMAYARFSPTADRVVTVSNDSTVRLWFWETGQSLSLVRHQTDVRFALFKPDGSQFITADTAGHVFLWDREGEFVREFHDSAWVMTAAFSPDGVMLVTATFDGRITQWQVDNGKKQKSRKIGTASITDLEFSPSGRQLLSVYQGKAIKLWKIPELNEDALLQHESTVEVAKFSHDGKLIAVGLTDGTLAIWSTGKRNLIFREKIYEAAIKTLEFRKDDRKIVSASANGDVAVGRIATDQRASHQSLMIDWQYLQGHERGVVATRFSPRDQLIATASVDNTVRVWHEDQELPLYTLRGHNDRIASLEFSQDGQYLVSASTDGTARVWMVYQSTGAIVLRGHHGLIFDAQFDPTGQYVVTSGADKTVRIWRSADGTLVRQMSDDGWVRSIRYSPDARKIVTASDGGTIRVWSPDEEGDAIVLEPHNGRQIWAEFGPQSERIVAVGRTKDSATLWDLKSPSKPVAWLRHENHVNDARFSQDGKLIVTASDDKTARLWNGVTGHLIRTFKGGHGDIVNSARFNNDASQILTVGEGGKSFLWNVSNGNINVSFTSEDPLYEGTDLNAPPGRAGMKNAVLL